MTAAPETSPTEPETPGIIRYKLYGQGGRFIEMTCQDTPGMRQFTRWVRMHDRYTNGVDEAPPPEAP